MRVADDSVDTERPSILPSLSERDIVAHDLGDMLDALTELLEEEIEYVRRGKSDHPDRITQPGA